MSAPATIPVTFSIKGCKCIDFRFDEFALLNKTEIPGDKYEFSFFINIRIDEKEKAIDINIKSILSSILFPKEQIATIDSVFNYSITNFEEVTVRQQDGTLGIYDQILSVFLTISTSTLRGMFAIKLDNSNYANAILPIMDGSQLLPQKTAFVG